MRGSVSAVHAEAQICLPAKPGPTFGDRGVRAPGPTTTTHRSHIAQSSPRRRGSPAIDRPLVGCCPLTDADHCLRRIEAGINGPPRAVGNRASGAGVSDGIRRSFDRIAREAHASLSPTGCWPTSSAPDPNALGLLVSYPGHDGHTGQRPRRPLVSRRPGAG